MRYCQYCKQVITSRKGAPTCKNCHELYELEYNRIRARIKLERPKHTREKIEVIKQKYAEGVPDGEIEQWIMGL